MDWKSLLNIPKTPADAERRRQISMTASQGKGRVYGDIYLPSREETKQKASHAIQGLQEAGKRFKQK